MTHGLSPSRSDRPIPRFVNQILRLVKICFSRPVRLAQTLHPVCHSKPSANRLVFSELQ
jgi:hypothetical protein